MFQFAAEHPPLWQSPPVSGTMRTGMMRAGPAAEPAIEQKHFCLGQTADIGSGLRPILSNSQLFGVDLYEAGLAPRIEAMFREEIAGPGAVRATLKKYLTAT